MQDSNKQFEQARLQQSKNFKNLEKVDTLEKNHVWSIIHTKTVEDKLRVPLVITHESNIMCMHSHQGDEIVQ